MLTEEEVKSGYWGEKWLREEIPTPITEVAEYQGGQTLAISCTQLSTTAARQKRIVAEWCDALPHFSAIKTLCFNTRTNQRLFDATARMPNLEALYIKWGGIKSIASIAGGQTLRVLRLGSNPAIQDIEQVKNLSQLSMLALENIPGARNLNFVAGLLGLEALGIDGSMWTTQVIDSLERRCWINQSE